GVRCTEAAPAPAGPDRLRQPTRLRRGRSRRKTPEFGTERPWVDATWETAWAPSPKPLVGTMPSMVEPRIVPRAEHRISRRDIDPDALRVLYRLRQFNHSAYLVGGSVRDLLLGRRPKDFDIGTSAHPYQV